MRGMQELRVNGEWSVATGEWSSVSHSPLTSRHSPKPIRFLTALLTLSALPALACDVCQKNQPAPLRGITHGTGPQSAWDMPIIWGAVVIVGITLVLAVKMLVRPGERQAGHIKHRILHDGL